MIAWWQDNFCLSNLKWCKRNYLFGSFGPKMWVQVGSKMARLFSSQSPYYQFSFTYLLKTKILTASLLVETYLSKVPYKFFKTYLQNWKCNYYNIKGTCFIWFWLVFYNHFDIASLWCVKKRSRMGRGRFA